MNYIFFDIECANCEGGQAKICSFGYVVTNEAFEVLEKEDLLVNPRAPFMLTGHRNRPYIKLAYDKEEFKKAPDFPGVYEKIRELLNRRDSLIFGYAADNDAGYLKSEFQRYALPCVNFSYYDLQKLLRFSLRSMPNFPDAPNSLNSSDSSCSPIPIKETGGTQISLSDALAMFSREVHQDVHKSDEDAWMTLCVLQGLCEKTGLSPLELIEHHPVCQGELKDGKVLVKIPEGERLLTRVLGDKSDRISPKSENRVLYIRFIRHVRPSGAAFSQWLKDLRVCIPEKYAERHYRDAMKLIQLVCDCGGRYTVAAESCHVFVSFPVYNDDGSPKICAEIQALEAKTPARRPMICSPDQFFALCGLKDGDFEKLPLPDVRYLLDERYAPRPKNQKSSKAPMSARDGSPGSVLPERASSGRIPKRRNRKQKVLNSKKNA